MLAGAVNFDQGRFCFSKNRLRQNKYTFSIDLTMCFLLQGHLGLWGIYRTSSQSITKTLAPILLFENFSKDNSCLLSPVIASYDNNESLSSLPTELQ